MKNKPYTDADIQCIKDNMHLPDAEQAGQFWNEEYGIDKRAMQTFQPYYLAYLKATKHNREKRSYSNYVNWITEKHKEFQRKGNERKTGDYSSRFLEWLNAL